MEFGKGQLSVNLSVNEVLSEHCDPVQMSNSSWAGHMIDPWTHETSRELRKIKVYSSSTGKIVFFYDMEQLCKFSEVI